MSKGIIIVAGCVLLGLLTGCRMFTEKTKESYGFRHDPMKWVENSDSVAAAQVRTFLLKKPKAGDKEILQKAIDKILSERKPDGSLGENTTGKLIRLSRLGCDPKRPEIKSAVKYIVKKEERNKDDGLIGSYGLYVTDWVDYSDGELIKRSTDKLVSHVMTMDFWRLCPWGGQVHTRGMWGGRKHADIGPGLDRGMDLMLSDIDETKGWPRFLDPFGFLDAAGAIDHPLSEEIIKKQIPMILRTQQTDGSWGGDKHLGYGPDNTTYIVLRALIKSNLLDELRKRPPLPQDWEIIRSIPAPKGDLSMLTSGGGRLWLYEKKSGEAIGVSSKDGSEVSRIKLPEHVRNIGWQDGKLMVQRVVEFVENEWDKLGVVLLDPDGKEPPIEKDGRAWRNEPWHVFDFYDGPPILLKRGKEPDWGDAPFGLDTAGVTSDENDLWVLDGKTNRISLIRKTASGIALTRPQPTTKMEIIKDNKPYDIPLVSGVKPGQDWSKKGFNVNVMAQIRRGIPQFGDNAIHMFKIFPANMSLAWNKEDLMLRIRAKDDKIAEADVDLDVWRRKGDCVFIDVAPNPEEKAYWRFVIAPGLTEKHPEPRVYTSNDIIPSSESPFQIPFKLLKTGINVKRKKLGDGYELDIRIPWERLGIKPEKGSEVGLQVFVPNRNTVSKAPFTAARWYPFSRPLQDDLGTHLIKLSDKASQPDNVVIEGGPGERDIAVTALGKYAGKKIVLKNGDKVIGTSVLINDPLSDFAIGSIPMLLDIDPETTLSVTLDGKEIGKVKVEIESSE